MNDAGLLLSRARVRRDAPVSALRALLVPSAESARVGAAHRLVWTLFADSPDRARDFLWREAEPGLFYLLSRRPPEDRHGLFDLDAPKPFEPRLSPGDRLAFALRANATVARVPAGRAGAREGVRGARCDVVMNAIHALPPQARPAERARAVAREGRRWLERQGERAGFVLPAATGRKEEDENDAAPSALRVTGYRTMRVDHGGPAARLGVLDFEGVLEVRDPAAFVTAIGQGFGRAKAFGCGLMLVRRA